MFGVIGDLINRCSFKFPLKVMKLEIISLNFVVGCSRSRVLGFAFIWYECLLSYQFVELLTSESSYPVWSYDWVYTYHSDSFVELLTSLICLYMVVFIYISYCHSYCKVLSFLWFLYLSLVGLSHMQSTRVYTTAILVSGLIFLCDLGIVLCPLLFVNVSKVMDLFMRTSRFLMDMRSLIWLPSNSMIVFVGTLGMFCRPPIKIHWILSGFCLRPLLSKYVFYSCERSVEYFLSIYLNCLQGQHEETESSDY